MAGFDKCTRSRNGSRCVSRRVIRCASVLMTRDFEREPPVVDQERKHVALGEQPSGAFGEAVQCREQRRRGLRLTERFDADAVRGEKIERDIDAVEIAVVGLAILQMIDDLQRRAQRIVGRPGAAALAVHVEHEAADRHRRQRTITDQIVPVAIAQLGHIELESGEQILCVPRRQRALGERRAQTHRRHILAVLADEARAEPVEEPKLLFRRKRRMVGDVVGGANEIVECQNRAAMARMDEKRRDRKVLVPVSFSRAPVGRVGHARIVHRGSETLPLCRLASCTLPSWRLACARPFHMPPRPRAC